MNSSTQTVTGSVKEEEGDNGAMKETESAVATDITVTTAAAIPLSAPPHQTATKAYSCGKDREAINHLLRHPLPNVLADMVTEYLFHPQFDLWEEVIATYESLPQMARHWQRYKEELMPKLHLSPSASPLEVDELEQQFQVKYAEPSFRFSSELKLLWSIADGLEAPQNMIFRGRFWPSLNTMKSILECPENSYYVIYHYHCQHQAYSAWFKYDFRSGVIYFCSSHQDQQCAFKESEMIIIFQSMTHFLKSLLAHLNRAMVDDSSSDCHYRLSRDAYPNYFRLYQLPGDPHPPAIDVVYTHNFVSKPDIYARDIVGPWDCLSTFNRKDLDYPRGLHAIIPGHLTSSEYEAIQQSICSHENQWVERLLNMTSDERWVKRAPKKEPLSGSTNHEMKVAVDGDDGGGDGAASDSGTYSDDREYCGFPVLSACHLLDTWDNTWCSFSERMENHF